MIRIFCRAADAILKETQTLTSGMTDYPTVELTFSDDWDGFSKAAVVRAGNTLVSALVTDNRFVIPYECLTSSGVGLSIGVSGSKDTQTIPTIWCYIGDIYEGVDVDGAENAGTPTPTLVQQMLEYAEACESAAEDAAEAASTAISELKVTSISSASTDDNFPTAKAVYDFVTSLLAEMENTEP